MVVTEAGSGGTATLAVGQVADLRLSDRYTWSEPQATGTAVRVMRVGDIRSAGYQEWTIAAVGPGTSTVASAGRPACTPGTICPALARAFTLTVVVS